MVSDEDKARELEAKFLEDVTNCEEWILEEYANYSTWHRFVDSV